MAAPELASIVAAYLRKHGFSKTLAAFFRENGDTPEEDIVDLETLYKFYISTQVDGNAKTKKLKKTKVPDTPEFTKDNEDARDNTKENVNGGGPSERKKNKKLWKENVVVDSPMVPKTQAKIVPKEEPPKKKRKEENPEEALESIEALKPKEENCLLVAGTVKLSVEEAIPNGHAGHGNVLNKLVVETHADNGGREVECPEKSLNKRSNKEKKEQGSKQLPGIETLISEEIRPVDNTQVSSQEDISLKKRRKKSKDAGGKATKDTVTADVACKTPILEQTEKLDAMKQPVETSGEPGGTSSKKKKQRKEFSREGAGDVNGSIQEPSDAKLEAITNEEELIESKMRSGKKRKRKEDTSLVNGSSNHDYNSTTPPDKSKEAGRDEGVDGCNVEKHESGSAKTKKHKEIPNNKKTPTAALAFQRVEVDKVSFSDPRLKDNSYWAKHGAEEGYGAKAQEVLGLVRGRDFRHEKTKKKRGSYRGGLIGLESHSIKFENSDED